MSGTAGVGVVSFYLPDQAALGGRDPGTLDCDREWQIFGTGVYVWVLQTFVRLRDAGAPVRLCKTAPASGIVVAHTDYVERLLEEAPSAANLTIVSARADRPQQIYADLEIVQNASSVEDFQIFIPSWLQPGLIPRRTDRGTRVENVAYVGARKQLHDELTTTEWVDALRRRDLSWELRIVTFTGNDQLYCAHRWNDYSASDVVVALRPPSTWNVTTKPAAKLTNAWAAGVPAIVSPEPPYRELRQSRLDYLEARSAADALDAIDRLRSDPRLYSAMVENGLARAREFHATRLTSCWAEALWQTVPARTSGAGYRLTARLRGYRALARQVRRRLRTLHPARSSAVDPAAG
jgi:glycosyl transferase family 1